MKRQKNGAADAEAICEAVQRPHMRFVAVKSEEQQASAMVFRTRDLLVRQRTQTINAIRGHMAEYGWVAPQGPSWAAKLADLIRDENGSSLPRAARDMLRVMVSLVTGGAQGLGRMIAQGLLSAGASVAITSRKEEVCRQAAAELAEFGECLPLAADLSSQSAATELAQRYLEAFGTCDILVNNAGKTWGGPIKSFPDKAWTSDPLEVLGSAVNFERFRALLVKGLGCNDGAKGGRPRFDPVSMFKVLVVQAQQNLSDARLEFMIRYRLSWMRFFGFDLGGTMPDESTIRHYRNRLTESGTLEALMQAF